MNAVLTETQEAMSREDRFLDALSAYEHDPTLANLASLKLAAIAYQLDNSRFTWVAFALKHGWFDVLETTDHTT